MKKFILFLAIIITFINSAYAGVIYYDDPLAVGIGARPVGMGRAFTAIADDCNAIFMNPGGLGSQDKWQLSSMSTNFLNEYQYTMLSGVYPTESGVYGIGFVSSGVANIDVTGGGTTNFYNQALVLSYGKPIGEYLQPYLGESYNIDGGANLKYYSKGFSGDEQAAGAGFNFDTGMKWKYSELWSFGLTFQNMLVGSKISGDFDPEEMPFVTKLGAAYYMQEYNLKFALDKDMFFGREVPWPFHFGLEWRAHPMLILRAGLDQVAGSSGGGDIATNSTFGIGFEYDGLKIDLAYMQNFADTNIASNFMSLSFFGEVPMPAKEAVKKEAAPPPAAEKAPEKPAVQAKPVNEKIRIISPQDKSYTFDSEILFAGAADPDVKEIWIADRKADIGSDGKFSAKVPLAYEKNVIKIRIKDAAGNEGYLSMSLARYYKPQDVTTEEAKTKYIDHVIIQTKVHEIVGKDYKESDPISEQELDAMLLKIKQMRQK